MAMDLQESQVRNLVKNFKFNYKGKMVLTIESLVPEFQDMIRSTVEAIYMQVGLDLAISFAYII